ncbi:IclR family transcriptional regulator [Hoeflea halophila]|uniref:IclR family transcriptional regulator n=1 Tax=Hoeflea halophila TaxID=714899 RepID=A0A286IA61_9HYPH|nr:IclR family transcriptional regulator [Hoeflea halophila]SOE17008.1 IclR family transcriptional regulator [Hoeflea halophila]
MPNTEDRIATNLRTLLILEAVGTRAEAMTPTEINQSLGLPKQTIHRLCATLVDEGFLVYEPNGRRLRTARRARLFGAGLLHSSREHILRRQVLVELAQKTGETINYVVPDDDGMSYLDRVETGWAFRVQLPIGTHVPFHCTASGKVFLASLDSRKRKAFCHGLTLDRKTSNTITDAEALLEELATVSKAGYAIDNGEFLDGMVAIAVPVTDDQGRFLAAIACHGPSIRLSTDTLRGFLDDFTIAVEKMQRVLI